ncbi:MAG: hypothetical protein EOP61_21775 [Sphingomonadales bacterium]|nr:MAG: hypothetical protein EOP61_21775 [Sphingomonadales bacterium]
MTHPADEASFRAMKHPAIRFLGLALLACAPDSGPEVAAVPEAETPKSPYSFDVNLTLTPRAAEMLASTDEAVNVAAMYYGEPVNETSPGIDEHGMEIGLGRDDIEVAPKSALVIAPGTGFDATNIASVKGEAEVLVNVYSARKTHKNNLISCGIYQGPISMAQKKPVDIKCDLIDGLNEDGDVVVETGTPGQ